MTQPLELPAYPRDWRALINNKGLDKATIHTATLTSASTIRHEQFLMLRVLWRSRSPKDLDWNRFDLSRWRAEAAQRLKSYPSWHVYCDSLAKETDADHIPESTFALAHQVQLQAAATAGDDDPGPNVVFTPVAKRTRNMMTAATAATATTQLSKKLAETYLATPTKSTRHQPTRDTELDSDDEEEEELDDDTSSISESSPPMFESPGYQDVLTRLHHRTEDEQIVNTALINFLNALTLHFRLYHLWSLHRKPFKARFTHASFEARLDGYLKDSKSGKVRALVEVKAAPRDRRRVPICMQEAAQMVAWIQSHPDVNGQLSKCGRRLHISQDRDEIFVIFAEYTPHYVDYIENRTAPEAYLTMHEFGPWSTGDVEHMRQFAEILVAIVLRAASDREVEEAGTNSPAGRV